MISTNLKGKVICSWLDPELHNQMAKIEFRTSSGLCLVLSIPAPEDVELNDEFELFMEKVVKLPKESP